MRDLEIPPARGRLRWAAAGVLAAAALGAVFLAPADWLPGSPRADLGQQFLAWRAFAASSLRAGHWPFWNPYVYGGEPFLDGFQSGLFYPPNAVFLVLPLCRAVNLSIALHLGLLGAGIAWWARRRGLGRPAALLAGIALPLSGPVFPQVYAGHLSNLCSLAWTPWVLGGLESWYERGGRRRFLLAAAAAGLQILAGQVQYCFFTGVAAVMQAVAAAAAGREARRRAPFVAGAYLLALALAAAQILPAVAGASEELRGGALPAAFAAQFSLPPENLLTAFAPRLFGGAGGFEYWGRCYWWDVSVFAGVSAIFLAAAGAADPKGGRGARTALALAAALLALSLGAHTPLFGFLRAWAPGFDRFRGWSKFAMPAAALFLLATAQGADAVLEGRIELRKLGWPALAAGLVLVAGGLAVARTPGAAAPWLARIRDTGESYLPRAAFSDKARVRGAGVQAGRSLELAGGFALVFGTALALADRRRAFRWAALAVLPAELGAFAGGQWAGFRLRQAVSPALQAYVAGRPGDYRVQNLVEPDNGFLIGAPDIWGNDPGLLRRYAEFMAYSQGDDPDQATQNVTFRFPSPLYRILRLRWIFTRTARGWNAYEMPDALGRALLVPDWRVIRGRDAILAAMSARDFDPARTAILEREPDPGPAGKPAGPDGARVVSEEPGRITVEADASRPSILLVTDGYSRDWRARALPGSTQERYAVMPGDYVLRATPLAPGHHLIEFEYTPSWLWAGLAISGAAWAGLLALLAAGAREEAP